MKRLYRSALVPGLLARGRARIFTPWATIDTPGTGIETVPADDVPIEQAPSSKNNNDAMVALLEFVVLWSVIYMVIKLVRKKLEKDKPYK